MNKTTKYGQDSGDKGKKSVNSSLNNVQQTNSSATVITRTAVPKYGNFQTARKKPKETSNPEEGNVREVEVNLSHLNKPSGRIIGSMAPIVVGQKTNEALRARTDSDITRSKHNHRTLPRRSVDLPHTQTVITPVSETSTKTSIHTSSSQTKLKGDKPVSVVDPVQKESTVTSPVQSTPTLATSESFTSNSNIFLEQWTKSASEAICLKEDNKSLKTQLEVQLQVNKELKRLLVASVGEDLTQKVENLIRDKAELSAELGDFAKKMTEDYENLDKVSIQADMWRSKYIASRLMIDDLAKSKAFYALQYQESQRVLQELLNERHELRSNLCEAYRCLQQVRDAFDPLNTHKSSQLQSSHVIDLAKTIQNLAETIRFRLLPPGPNFNSHMYNQDARSLPETLTKGESLAQQLLSRKMDLSQVDGQTAASSEPPSSNFKFDRYHPQTCYDNLTFNCCGECKGEIRVL